MSAEFDLEIYQIFISEIGDTAFDGEAKDDEQIRGSLLYICLSLVRGGFSDFLFDAALDSDGKRVEGEYYAPTRTYLDALKCRPLLEPWLQEYEWSRQAVADLKATHAVTQSLTNKDH
jgi:hypothetical protein